MMACWLVVRLLAPAQSAGSCREAREEGEGGPVLDRDAVLAVVVAAAVDEEAVAGRAERGVAGCAGSDGRCAASEASADSSGRLWWVVTEREAEEAGRASPGHCAKWTDEGMTRRRRWQCSAA